MNQFKTIEKSPLYEINREGVVRRKDTGNVRKYQFCEKRGYPYLMLPAPTGSSKKFVRCYIHRLMAEAFIPNPEGFPVVMHLDDNVKNFSLSNLKWGTQKENMQQSSATGFYSTVKKSVKLISPTGEVVEVTGLRGFCEEQGLDWGNFQRLVSRRVQMRGGRPRYTNSVKGWRLYDCE